MRFTIDLAVLLHRGAGCNGFAARNPSYARTVPGYPVIPAVFIAAGVYLVGNALVSDPMPTAVTGAIILAGVPVYYLAFRKT